MKIVQTISACAVTIGFAMSIASAQQAMKGVVTAIDEPAGTISIQQTASGTVGAQRRRRDGQLQGPRWTAVQCLAPRRQSRVLGRNYQRRKNHHPAR